MIKNGDGASSENPKKSNFDFAKYVQENHEMLIQFCRITSMVYRFKDIIRLGGFDSICNSMGGMEDHEFFARLLLSNLQIKTDSSAKTNDNRQYNHNLRTLLSAMEKPLAYFDSAWEKLNQDQKNRKYSNEINSLIGITRYLSEKFRKAKQSGLPTNQPNFYTTPVSRQDFRLNTI